MEEVLQQAPENLELAYVQSVFEKHNENVIDTLSELWSIKIPQEKEKTKWDTIRDTCDAFDVEMQKVFKKKC